MKPLNLPFFNNALNSGMTPQPNDMYRNLQQAFISQQYDNTTALHCIQEQLVIGSNEYNEVEAWVVPIVEDSTTGRKAGRDFAKLLFENLNHVLTMGLYYQFDNNYWLTYFFNDFTTVEKDISVRRCNNYLRIIDPLNGSLFSAPCTVDYDMSSPSVQVTSNILTPNNHATVMVQGNATTIRLFQTNTRYILGGRPFKLTGYQNAMMQDGDSNYPTLLYLDLYLDEIHAADNLELQIADNGVYNYVVSINSDNMELANGSSGSLTANVSLNGLEVDRTVLWSSSDASVVTVNSAGAYKIVGEIGSTANIVATLSGNANVVSEISVTVVDVAEVVATVIIEPLFDVIREYETITFEVSAFYNGVEYSPSETSVLLNGEDGYLSVVKNGNVYELTCLKRAVMPQLISVSVSNVAPVFEAETSIAIQCVSMMG